MQRMGMVIGLKPEKIAEYKRLHAAVWPEILDMISKCNIRAQLVLMTTTPLVLDYNKSAIIVSRAGSGDEFPMSVTKIETIADDNVHSGGRLATIRSSATIRINGLSNQSLRDFATDELKISLGLGAVHGSGPLGIGPFKLIEQPGEQPHKKEWTAEI